jgi:hypothetical protein
MNTASQLQAKPEKKVPPLRAYLVSEGDPETDTIQFAHYNIVARREGACELGVPLKWVTCKRLHWADDYARQAYIPPQAYIDNGWRYSCRNCASMISDELADEHENGDQVPHEPVYEGENVYCCPACKHGWEQERANEARRKQEVIDVTLAKFPGVNIVSVSDHETQRWVRFMFPGSIGAASWSIGNETVSVDQRDVEAWHAWRALFLTAEAVQ